MKKCRTPLTAALLSLVCLQYAPPAQAARAKDMFYQQLETSTPTNTGVSYWIELRRGKGKQKVDSRFAFKSGDRIKFHLTANVDGHAHVVLIAGTTGKKAVLFPVQGKDATNGIKKGRDLAVPAATFLVFDRNAGKERVRIAVSRKNIDSASLLEDNPGTKIAMANITRSAAIDPTAGNEHLLVAFPEENKESVAQAKPDESDAIANAIPNEPEEEMSKDLFREDSAPRPAHKPRPAGHKPASKRQGTVRRKPSTAHKPPAPVTPPPQTIIVNENPSDVLYAEVVLEHN
ncbi:MAG: DUF4384 domain-containing protein [Cyanobacteria bacterium]|nr:DUF4384 domain-containing protein [Cyanobacteriota bacterium]